MQKWRAEVKRAKIKYIRQCIRALQRNTTNGMYMNIYMHMYTCMCICVCIYMYIFMYKFIYYKQLPHMIMEVGRVSQ